MQLFLKPIWSVLSKLESTGIKLSIKIDGIIHHLTSRVILLAGTCDLPAKSLINNFRQYNGFYGCAKCLQPGITLTLGPRSHTHIYPYIDDNPSGPQRTHEQTFEDVAHVMSTGVARNGVLGPSWFQSLKYYDLVRGTAIDYMHCCLLGVVRRMLNLWLSSPNSGKPYYIGHLTTLIDRRLLSIKPISELSRAARSVTDRAHWKASEFRSFLLYYSLPVLKDILPEHNFKHFALLVTAIRKLLNSSIQQQDLELCTEFINLFCKHYNNLYGDQEMTANVHSLLHLTENVKDLGPLWVYSCFYFEGLNGLLLKHVHGTQGIGLQFLTHFSTMQSFPLPENMPLIKDPPSFLKMIANINSSSSSVQMKGLGRAKCSSLTSDELVAFNQAGYCAVGVVRRFARLLVNGVTFSSLPWKENQRRHNSTVCFQVGSTEKIGQIKTFLEITDSVGGIIFIAFIQLLNCSQFPEISVSGLHAAEITSHSVAVNASHIIEKCMYMVVDDTSYVSKIIDPFEKD